MKNNWKPIGEADEKEKRWQDCEQMHKTYEQIQAGNVIKNAAISKEYLRQRDVGTTGHATNNPMTKFERIQKEYDVKLAELDRLIAENNAKLAANHLAMQAAIADAQAAISTAKKLKQ